MKKLFLLVSALIITSLSFSQSSERVEITTTNPITNAGQNYSAWLNDDVQSLINNVWSPDNFKYTDIKLVFKVRSNIASLSLYDFEGIFTDNPATIYAVDGGKQTYLGVFTGELYMKWIDIILQNPIIADAIIIHKYGNNVPEKIRVFGQSATGANIKKQAVINFPALNERSVNDGSFSLNATSNNTTTPIEFTSSNPGIVSVSKSTVGWEATIVAPGTGTVTATQSGNDQFEAASSVVQNLVIKPDLIKSVINFDGLGVKTIGDAAFNLIATSNNAQTPVTFVSSNPSVLSIANINGVWKATIIAAGTANVTASQAANTIYSAATDVVKSQIVNPAISLITEGDRIKIISAIPAEQTGQDFSPWLNDDMTKLISNSWSSSNFKYINVKLTFEKRSKVERLSLYDYEGIFTDNPVTIYALNGTQSTLIGTFTGEAFMKWVDINLATAITADAIIIHKYGNNIPQKIKVFGHAVSGVSQPIQAIITFSAIPNKVVGDAPFVLVATSNNNQTPIVFSSSNPAVVSVSNASGVWKATAVAEGSANITASQPGNSDFTPAANVTRSVVVSSPAIPTTTTVPPVVATGKIPIDGKRWYQLNNTSVGLDGLFDGITATSVNTGWGHILPNFDAYYPLLDGEEINIESIKLYDGAGSNENSPFTLSIITKDWKRIPVATFTGGAYMQWVGPYINRPSKFQLDQAMKDVRYLVINTTTAYPNEIELYGSYKAGPAATPAKQKNITLNQAFGINAFEWDFENPSSPGQVEEARMKAIKTFTGVRHYMDWEKLEQQPGSYTFNPTYSGGWNYDAIYERCKAEGIEVLACLKTIPAWMQNTYPADQRDLENVPVKYGKDFSDPKSYLEQAKVAFQYAARYGSNKNLDRALLNVNSQPRWGGDVVNTVKVGLGLIRYIECDNERDKWWKGRKAYQTAREYAANLSAFYDGHKGTMGAGVGVKNADPGMQVVMAGLALASTDYVKGMIDWCKEFRGYKADGSVNLCWDIINYHLYSNDSKSSQSGNATRGAAPEVTEAKKVAKDFIKMSHDFAGDMPVWITECGYDVNQGSTFKAISIGQKSVLQTQADWMLRTALLYARLEIERVFFYQLYDDNINNPLQFSSSGLINQDHSRKPAADFLYQAKKLLGKYSFKETLNEDPIVDRYELDGKSVYTLVVPDEKGRTASYTLNLNAADSAFIYTPRAGSEDMDLKKVKTVNGKITLTVTETPVFVTGSGTTTSLKSAAKLTAVISKVFNDPATYNFISLNASEVSAANATDKFDAALNGCVINIYPNPVTDYLNISVSNGSADKVNVRILEAASGRLFKMYELDNSSSFISNRLNVDFLPSGYYIVQAQQGLNTVSKKILIARK